MQIIRDRVATKGASFDTFPGLGLKCFLIQEKGKLGARSNRYAPVYLWPDAESMMGFLAGTPFGAIKESFGVPPVETWAGLALSRSRPLFDPTEIAWVTREDIALSSHTDLVSLRARERDEAAAAVDSTDGLIARAVGLDPRSWRLVRFEYWEGTHAELRSDVESYEVLHVSAPAIEMLKDSVPA